MLNLFDVRFHNDHACRDYRAGKLSSPRPTRDPDDQRTATERTNPKVASDGTTTIILR